MKLTKADKRVTSMIELNQSTKKHDRNGKTKSRIWIEENKTNRFLSAAGFTRGTRYRIEIDRNVVRIIPDDTGPLKVSGKTSKDGSPDRALMDITKQRQDLPEFYPNGSNSLSIIVEQNLITVKVIER